MPYSKKKIYKNPIIMTRVVAGLLIAAALTIGFTAAAAEPKPNEPITQVWIPAPKFTTPTPYQKFTLAPTLAVNLNVNIPNVDTGYTVPPPFDFVAYAKASPFTEKWLIEIIKQGPSGNAVSLQTFEGMITGYQFSLSLNADWFKKHGPGKYAATAYLSQTTSQGTVAGLATGQGFEILSPPVKMSDQKPGNAVAVPPKLPLQQQQRRR